MAGKERISIRLDKDILAFFKENGAKGYQSRINAFLRLYALTKAGKGASDAKQL